MIIFSHFLVTFPDALTFLAHLTGLGGVFGILRGTQMEQKSRHLEKNYSVNGNF